MIVKMIKKSAAMVFLALAIAILPVSAWAGNSASGALGEAVLQNNYELFVAILKNSTEGGKQISNSSNSHVHLEGKDNQVCRGETSHTLIQAIVVFRRYKMAAAYLEKGHNPNVVLPHYCRETALQLAIKMKDKRMINLLLKHGAR